MSVDGLEQLSAIMGLTRQRDGISLTRSMLASLDRQLAPAKAHLLEVFGHRRLNPDKRDQAGEDLTVRRFAESAERVRSPDPGPGVMEAIRRLQPVAIDSPTQGTGRLVVPLWGDMGPLRLVVVDDLPMDPIARAKLLQVVDIYANLIKLMDSRERDHLTGLLNRQIFAALFEAASRRVAASEDQHLWLGVLDIDRFKRINDDFGHLFGDEVLIHFARLMERSFRYTDDIFRFGGEEFIVLMAADVPNAPRCAFERFRARVEAHPFPGVGQVTVSVGFVECRPGRLPTSYIDMADKALYHAKETGRNRVVDHADLGEDANADAGEVDLF